MSTLYIVATPIGNLADITFRAVKVLKDVDLILCEDTRVTKKLLDHYKIETPTKSYHQHSKPKILKEIQLLLKDGKDLALVTDAGTPTISDPGNVLVNTISKHEAIKIVPIPGPSALVCALSVAGLKADKFLFLGFPPNKNKRQKFFSEVAGSRHTVVFYESGHRINKTIRELFSALNNNNEIVVARELTKKFETIYRGTINELSKMIIKEKGEFVVILSPSRSFKPDSVKDPSSLP